MWVSSEPIIVSLRPNNLGRVLFSADVLGASKKQQNDVEFKLDSGSDFTIISRRDLIRSLGYSKEFLNSCPLYYTENPRVNATQVDGTPLPLRYIKNISMMVNGREIINTRIFFQSEEQKGKETRNLFGTDILKYFNWSIDYDKWLLTLSKRNLANVELSPGEKRLEVYDLTS
ncbi:MAG: hypothetical protein LBS21_02030 [Clostridiales bacterium]|jgi:hypothetical protein|nr:hypothetical protein [Clostridiales bacterium]